MSELAVGVYCWLLLVAYFALLFADAGDSFKTEMRHSGWRAFFMPSLRARRRARRLLMEHLTPTQRRRFLLLGSFDVTGPKTGATYRIHQRYLYSVAQRSYGIERALWCAYVKGGRYPLPDQMLALKLMIETDEYAFREVAIASQPFWPTP